MDESYLRLPGTPYNKCVEYARRYGPCPLVETLRFSTAAHRVRSPCR